MLGRKDYDGLSRRQRNSIVRHFLHITGAPPWILFFFATRQWPCDAEERKSTPVIHSQTALLTFQGFQVSYVQCLSSGLPRRRADLIHRTRLPT